MPLFRVFFVLQNATRPTANLPGLTLDPVVIEGSRAKVDLTLVIADTGRELIGTLEYNADLFESMTMKRLLAHFQTLLESLVETPDQPLSSLRLLSDAESAGQTPLDFPDIQLSQQDFETILMEIG
jgi:non-ribosomal peptide synthetase component F